MGMFKNDKPVSATIGDKRVYCLMCGGAEFWIRAIKLNTTGMEFMDLAWANRASLGLVCGGCGYIHEFLGDSVKLWETTQ